MRQTFSDTHGSTYQTSELQEEEDIIECLIKLDSALWMKQI